MTKRTDEGFVLCSPTNIFYAETFSTDKEDCWSKSFAFLYNRKKWMKPFYKQWSASIKAAEKRGWTITTCRIDFD